METCENTLDTFASLTRDTWVEVQGPPGAGKTSLMARLIKMSNERALVATASNEAALVIYGKLQALEVPVLLLISSKANELNPSLRDLNSTNYRDSRFKIRSLPKNAAIIGTTAMIIKMINPETRHGTISWFDESSSIEGRTLDQWAPRTIRAFGDKFQLGTYSGQESLADRLTNEQRTQKIVLNRTYRLSTASLTPLSRFYPGIKSLAPDQGLRTKGRDIRGCHLVNFRSGTRRSDRSHNVLHEQAYVLHLAAILQRASITTLVASPYSAQTLQPGNEKGPARIQTIYAIRGLECEVTLISMTHQAMTQFQLQPERLIVAISRASKATIIVGDTNRLQRTVSWFQNSDVWCPYVLEKALSTNLLTTF